MIDRVSLKCLRICCLPMTIWSKFMSQVAYLVGSLCSVFIVNKDRGSNKQTVVNYRIMRFSFYLRAMVRTLAVREVLHCFLLKFFRYAYNNGKVGLFHTVMRCTLVCLQVCWKAERVARHCAVVDCACVVQLTTEGEREAAVTDVGSIRC